MQHTASKKKTGLFMRFVQLVEALGNRLPHPLYLYVVLIVLVLVISSLCASAGISATYEQVDPATGELTTVTVQAVDLLSRHSLQTILANWVNAYDANTVLPAIMAITMFVSIADRSGLFSAAMHRLLLVMGKSRWITTYVLALAGVCSTIMADAGVVLAVSLGAVVFKSVGRIPWLGIMVGCGAGSVGFCANLCPANTDVLSSTITNSVSIPLGIEISPLCNYYFKIVAALLLSAAIAVVCETFLVKLLGDTPSSGGGEDEEVPELSTAERRGLHFAGIALLILVAGILALSLPRDGFFRNDAGELLPQSPLVSSLAALLCILFLFLGVSYGIGSGTIASPRDVPQMMGEGIKGLAGLIVNFFPIALLVYVFGMSNLANVLAVAGEKFFRSIGLTGLPMLCVFAVVVGVSGLFMYGGSSRWAIFAPVFIPMFLRLDLHPILTQLAYRIGDSWSANITPLNACLVITLTMMEHHRNPEINPDPPGLGTILAAQIPISLACLVLFLLELCAFVLLGISPGPDVLTMP